MWIDITRTLEPGMTVYPDDPAFQMETETHDIYKVSRVALCVHSGTHIDAPSHFLLDGDTESYQIDQLCGDAVVLNWGPNWLTRAAGVPRVLLRGGEGLSADEARAAARQGVRLIGTDRLSIAPFDNEAATHRTLLEQGVCILENADLSAAPEGRCRLICLPMKLKGSDGAPVRAFLIREPEDGEGSHDEKNHRGADVRLGADRADARRAPHRA